MHERDTFHFANLNIQMMEYARSRSAGVFEREKGTVIFKPVSLEMNLEVERQFEIGGYEMQSLLPFICPLLNKKKIEFYNNYSEYSESIIYYKEETCFQISQGAFHLSPNCPQHPWF